MKESKETLEKILKEFSYDTETGKVFRKGKEAGYFGKRKQDHSAYGTICFNYEKFPTHRIAWALYYKRWPLGLIDHKDGDGTNNKIENLREADKKLNSLNSKMYSNNTTKIAGISFDSNVQHWRVRSGKIYIGVTKDFFEACCMRKSWELQNNVVKR